MSINKNAWISNKRRKKLQHHRKNQTSHNKKTEVISNNKKETLHEQGKKTSVEVKKFTKQTWWRRNKTSVILPERHSAKVKFFQILPILSQNKIIILFCLRCSILSKWDKITIFKVLKFFKYFAGYNNIFYLSLKRAFNQI